MGAARTWQFLGIQEAWLSLAASIFDMAIYPTLFVIYLKQMAPWFGVGIMEFTRACLWW